MGGDPRAVALRFYEIVNRRDPDGLDEVCAPDLRGHAGAGGSLAELKQNLGSFLAAFPDLTAEVRYLVCEDDLASGWVSYQGTHQDTFAGVPASGRPVRFVGWDLLRVRDGQVVELTQYCDLFTILNQIGALPTATPA